MDASPGESSAEHWTLIDAADPDVIELLRAHTNAEVHIRFGIGTGNAWGVDVPAQSLTLQGVLMVEPVHDRFAIAIEGWGADDFVWISRRRGRGRPDYWQGAVEYRPTGRPALVCYFTAPLDELQIRIRSDAR